ncbi:hypothetical protein EVAR_84451_1 [Eumeta japonica]|uniref:Uncharacterized protein n=1 Tax=Eumeta variegata TaxID=151549 RepID=A0A4C1W289_EUMVA|nr:hypothetical protein EVAR_84451_1 [Eumeta japonica]
MTSRPCLECENDFGACSKSGGEENCIAEVPEQKVVAYPVGLIWDLKEHPLYTLAKRVSSWSKILRIIIYVHRF